MEENFKHRPFWLAGELAAAAGVSTDTLRHYERKGVLPKPNRSPNGYRRYPADALERVRLIRNALAVGFTLDELSRFLSERDQGGAPCGAVRALAAEKLTAIDEQLKRLSVLREELRSTITDWDKRLSTIKPGMRAGLLETLSVEPGKRSMKLSPNLIGKEGKNDKKKSK